MQPRKMRFTFVQINMKQVSYNSVVDSLSCERIVALPCFLFWIISLECILMAKNLLHSIPFNSFQTWYGCYQVKTACFMQNMITIPCLMVCVVSHLQFCSGHYIYLVYHFVLLIMKLWVKDLPPPLITFLWMAIFSTMVLWVCKLQQWFQIIDMIFLKGYPLEAKTSPKNWN